MNRKYCKILIIIFVFLFLASAPLAIFYAQGYRLDFENKAIVKTGGIFIKANVNQSRIYIDNKFEKNTDFIFGEAFIKNLLPKEYNIRVEKEGYVSWEKALKVEEELVTKAENIILFSKAIKFLPLNHRVNNYFISPCEEKIIVKKQGEDGYFLELMSLKKDETKIILTETEIEGSIINIVWNHNSEDILLEIQDEKIKESSFYIIQGLEVAPSKNILTYLVNAEKINFNPYNLEEIFFIENNNEGTLFNINFAREKIPKKIADNIRAYDIYERNLFWLDRKGVIYKSNLSGGRPEIINKEAFPVQEGHNYKIKIFEEEIFIEDSDSFYHFNKEKETFERILNNSKEIKISPDRKKISIINNHEIYLFFLSEVLEQPKREKSQKVFLTRLSKEIKDIFWLNNHYLLFNTGDEIKIAETDNRNGLNIITIGEYENPEIFWNNQYKRIYILSKDNLYYSDLLF
jgi:hypothetical protein